MQEGVVWGSGSKRVSGLPQFMWVCPPIKLLSRSLQQSTVGLLLPVSGHCTSPDSSSWGASMSERFRYTRGRKRFFNPFVESQP